MLRKIFISLILLCIAFNVFASTDLGTLSPVTISAQRTADSVEDSGAQVTVITSEQIEKIKPESVANLVDTISCVSISGYGSLGSIQNVSILGAGTSRTQVYLNGCPVVTADSSTFDLSVIPVSVIERVEVITSGAGKNGQNVATGGIINIITKDASKQPKVSVSFENGSFLPLAGNVSSLVDSQTLNTSFAGKIGKQNLLVALGATRAANRFSFKNDTTNKNWTIRENAALGSVNADFGLSGKIGNADYSSFNIVQYNHLRNPGSVYYPPESSEYTNHMFISTTNSLKTGKTMFALNYIYKPLSYHSYAVSSYNKHNIDLKADTKIDISENVSVLPYAEFLVSLVKSKSYVKEMETRLLPKIGLTSSIALGNLVLFPMADVSFASDIKKVIPGASIGAELSIVKNLTGFTNISYASNLPSFDDMYYPLDSYGYQGNPNLKPEKALSGDIGIKFDNTVISCKASFFTRYIHDMIKITSDYSTMENLENALFMGLDQSVNLTKNNFNFSLGYLFNKSFNLSLGNKMSDNVSVDNVRMNTITFLLGYSFGKVSISTDGKYLGKYYLYGVQRKGAVIMNASVDYNVSEKTKLYIKVDNLLNTQYELIPGYPISGLKIRLGGSWCLK